MTPENTLEAMIYKMWTDCLDKVSDHFLMPLENVQKLVSDTRKIVADAGWPAAYTHDFFVGLKNELKAGSLGHPTTKRLIRLLEIELELN